ncbi:uncharacterized protein LOC108957136 [Eucalyptus grandis]|uniref:uncharacterized protein LOC108957136 n=1 Tax=Eucalyptus grandis TaxID=71139 RepID=UPI00192EEC6E|nr:uncharacterized protein LOC108957136 [Eucalyptus grandis]
MTGSSSAKPHPSNFTKLQLGCPGSSSSSSPTQNAKAVTPQGRDLLRKDTVAMEGSSSAPPFPFNFTKLQLGCPGSSSSSSPTQNANVVTSQEPELPGKDLKRKRSSHGVVPYNNKRPVPRHKEEKKDDAGISTKLTLRHDPCNYKKVLTTSDVGGLSRLLLSGGFVEDRVVGTPGMEMVKSPTGMEVPVWDADDGSKHWLVLGHWPSSNAYVLKGHWNEQFVKRLGLVAGDEIGLLWDPYSRRFFFKVLHKVACDASNAAA